MAAIPDTYKLTATSIQLKDVYNIAQKVGEEFQTLIQKFGGSHTAMLVEMVIAILEHLENLVDVANHIQIKHCQLLLHRDNLLREKEEIKVSFQSISVSFEVHQRLPRALFVACSPTLFPIQEILCSKCANASGCIRNVWLETCCCLLGNSGT